MSQYCNGIRHTFTNRKSLLIEYNYYGLIYIPNSSSYKNVVVKYNNIISKPKSNSAF